MLPARRCNDGQRRHLDHPLQRACDSSTRASAWRRSCPAARGSAGGPFAEAGRHNVADDRNSRPSRAYDRAALEGLGLASNQLAQVARLRNGWSVRGRDGADQLVHESADSPPDMPRRTVHPLDAARSTTLTMPTTPRSGSHAVRSACSATACSARWRTSTLTLGRVPPAGSSSTTSLLLTWTPATGVAPAQAGDRRSSGRSSAAARQRSPTGGLYSLRSANSAAADSATSSAG